MELVEIKGLFEMDYGAPLPIILSSDNELLVAFFIDKENAYAIPQECDIYDAGVLTLEFKQCLKYTFGMPGNESMYGHPYSKLGMQACSFYELRNSDLIESLREIDKIHPFYNSERWKMYKHYILTFHDNMFECVARGFEIIEEKTSFYNEASGMLVRLNNKDL